MVARSHARVATASPHSLLVPLFSSPSFLLLEESCLCLRRRLLTSEQVCVSREAALSCFWKLFRRVALGRMNWFFCLAGGWVHALHMAIARGHVGIAATTEITFSYRDMGRIDLT